MNYLIIAAAIFALQPTTQIIDICDNRENLDQINTIAFVDGDTLVSYTYSPPIELEAPLSLTREGHYRLLINGEFYFPKTLSMQHLEIAPECRVTLMEKTL